VSAALGELFDWASDFDSPTRGLSFVKFGLAGCAASPARWHRRWRDAIASLPPSVKCVPVAYADEHSAGGPSLVATMDWAAENGCEFMLIDTFCKDGRDLARFCDQRTLGELLQGARRRGLRLGLAGGLARAALKKIVSLGPDLVGVRGAACRGGRLGDVDESLVRSLAALVARGQPA
jgi:(5-formylfuran-3-yl)methyl phosphate synthase